MERTIDNKRPICPVCGRVCQPAGGVLDGSLMSWACFDCNYRLDDILIDVEYKDV